MNQTTILGRSSRSSGWPLLSEKPGGRFLLGRPVPLLRAETPVFWSSYESWSVYRGRPGLSVSVWTRSAAGGSRMASVVGPGRLVSLSVRLVKEKARSGSAATVGIVLPSVNLQTWVFGVARLL